MLHIVGCVLRVAGCVCQVRALAECYANLAIVYADMRKVQSAHDAFDAVRHYKSTAPPRNIIATQHAAAVNATGCATVCDPLVYC